MECRIIVETQQINVLKQLCYIFECVKDCNHILFWRFEKKNFKDVVDEYFRDVIDDTRVSLFLGFDTCKHSGSWVRTKIKLDFYKYSRLVNSVLTVLTQHSHFQLGK